MLSAVVFTVQCYIQCGLCCHKVSVCLSVCHTVLSQNGSTYSQTFFTIILVFPQQTLWQYSDACPLTGRRMQAR